MKTYTAIKETTISNTIIAELNAKVLTATFPGKGAHLADRYTSPNTADEIVYHNSCAPIHSTFVETIRVVL